MKIFNFVFYFMLPAILINTREAAKSKQQLWIESAREATKTNTITAAHLDKIRKFNEYLEETRVAFLIFKRNELTLENIVQIFLQCTMVLLSPVYTEHTATNSGLQSVFKERKKDKDTECKTLEVGCHLDNLSEDLIGVGESSVRILLTLSVLLSIKTTATTYVKIKTEDKINSFPLLPKLFLAMRALFAYCTRTICVVGFFVPFLGLLDVLAHWKSEQANKEIKTNYTKYTGTSLGEAFQYFMLGLFVQTLLALAMKWAINKDFRAASLEGKLQHTFLIANLPDNYGDWTSGGGGVEDLRRRRRMQTLETIFMILLQFFSHILMVIPFWVTGWS